MKKIIVGLDNSNILYKAMRYLTISFFYLLRNIDKEELEDAFRSVVGKDNQKISPVTEALINQKTELLNFTDFQLERYAEWRLRRNMKAMLEDESNFLTRVFQLLAVVGP